MKPKALSTSAPRAGARGDDGAGRRDLIDGDLTEAHREPSVDIGGAEDLDTSMVGGVVNGVTKMIS